VGVPYTPTGIDPHVNSSELAYKLFSNLFDPLVSRTTDGQFAPGLAEEWRISPDGRTYWFRLRPRVSFHDGTACDAAAVKASFDRVVDPETRSQAAKDMLGPYADAVVLGPRELELRLSQPYAPFLDALSQAWLAPAAPQSFGNRLPVGTGPFRAVEWEPGGDLVLEANPTYHLGAPALERIVFSFIPEHHERLAALRKGRIHAFYEYPPTAVAEIGDFKVDVVPVPGAPVSLMMNVSRAPTNDRRVRRALAHALDVHEIVQRVFGGVMPVATAPLSSTTWGYDGHSGDRYPRDPALAPRLLAEVTHELGPLPPLIFYAIPHASYPEIGAEIARQLKPLGVEVELRVVGIGEWIAAGNSGAHHLITVGKFTSEPDVLEVLFHSRHVGNGYNWTLIRDGLLDAQLETAVQSLDPERRRSLFSSIQRRIVDQALTVPIHENTNVTVVRPELVGLSYDLRGYPVLYGAALAGPPRPPTWEGHS
jgi:peptide/nickel transport system substrate-binding protein